MPFSLQDINTKLGAYAAFKKTAAEAALKVTARKMELQLDPELVKLEKLLDIARADEDIARKELEDWALAIALVDKTKKPHPAISIRESVSLVYDSALAVAWCIGKQLQGLLTVKGKAFEAVLDSEVELPKFVTTQVKKVVVITNPEQYIPKAPEVEPPAF